MRYLLLVVLSAAAWAQSQSLIRITPKQDNSAPGEIRFFSLYGVGQHSVGVAAQNSMAADFLLKWPAALPATNGECLTSTTAGVMSFAACSGLPVSDSTALVFDNGDATKRLRIEAGGITTAFTRVWTAPDANITVVGTNYPQTFVEKQKFRYGTGGYDEQVTLFNNSNPSGSYTPACLALSSTDTVGTTEYVAGRLCGGFESASLAAEKIIIQTPSPSGWQTPMSWQNLDTRAYGTLVVDGAMNATGNVTSLNNISAGPLGQLSGNTLVVSGSAKASSAVVAGNATVPTAISGTLLHVVGADSVLPRIVVDAFAASPAVNFRRSNGSAASPSAVITNDILFNLTAFGYGATGYSGGGRVGVLGYAAETWTDTAQGAYLMLGTTAIGSAAYVNRWQVTDSGHFVPVGNNVYTIGLTGTRPSKVWTVDLDVSGTCTGCSSVPVVDTTAIVFGSSDATKRLRFEVDGFTTSSTRVATFPNQDITVAGLQVVGQTFLTKQTISAPTGSELLAITNEQITGSYAPGCIVLGATDTVTSAKYGAAQLCGGYTGAAFTSDRFVIQTATSASTYETALMIENKAISLYGALDSTSTALFSGAVTSGGFFTLSASNLGALAAAATTVTSIDSSGFSEADSFRINGTTVINSSRNATFVDATLSGNLVMGVTTVINSSRNLVGLNTVNQGLFFGTDNTYDIGSSGSSRPRHVYIAGNSTIGGNMAVGGTLSTGGTLTPNRVADLIPYNSTRSLGGPFGSEWDQIWGNVMTLSTGLYPVTDKAIVIGSSGNRVNAAYLWNAYFYNTIQAPSGALGMNTTVTVRNSAGTGTCTITYSSGLATGTTC